MKGKILETERRSIQIWNYTDTSCGLEDHSVASVTTEYKSKLDMKHAIFKACIWLVHAEIKGCGGKAMIYFNY